jgi:hypothetical protein
MARFYSNENLPLTTVMKLRELDRALKRLPTLRNEANLRVWPELRNEANSKCYAI